MTKEEQLKQEAEEYQIKLRKRFTPLEQICWGNIYKAYIAGAEPREKRIEELEQQVVQLKKDVTENESDCANCGLRQENAELKKEVLEVRQHLELTEREWGKDTVKLCLFKTQLTKATEILEKLANMEYVIKPPADKVRSLMVKAEKFLKEIKENG